jgi:hypothetical protein
MHIFKHFKCFIIQIFSKFKYDVPHISMYFLSPISKFRENITYFYIFFSLLFLNLRSRTNKSTKYSIQII